MIRSNDDWYEKFQEVYGSEDRIKQEAWDRLVQYVKAGWAFACGQVYLNIPDDEAELKAFVENGDAVRLQIGEADIIPYAMVNAGGDGDYDDDETAWEIRQMQGEGYSGDASWETIDDENTMERRREEGVTVGGYGRDRNKDPWLEGLDTTTKSLTADYLDVLQGNPIPGRIPDERQNELKFESMKLGRLLQLSGVV
jgi:hypothetical protein